MKTTLFTVPTGVPVAVKRACVVIGRSPAADVVIANTMVSSRHCELRFDTKGKLWYVIDLKSKNGTQVNREMIARAALNPGDTLTIAGRFSYQIRYDPDEVAAELLKLQDENILRDVMTNNQIWNNIGGPATLSNRDPDKWID